MNLGKLNYWFGRVLTAGNRVVQPMNFLMLIYLTSKEQPLAWLLVPAGFIFAGFWYAFDTRKVIHGELAEWFDRNPRFVEMQSDIKEIKERLDG